MGAVQQQTLLQNCNENEQKLCTRIIEVSNRFFQNRHISTRQSSVQPGILFLAPLISTAVFQDFRPYMIECINLVLVIAPRNCPPSLLDHAWVSSLDLI